VDGLDFTEKATILVVDDTPENLAFMRSVLMEDYKVKVATGGERALKIANSEAPPDLILLDVMMPGMDGYEVCRQLKLDPRTENIPIIFVTARADVDDESKGLRMGAVDYIAKPISPPIVLARVKNHLALKATTDFLRDKSDFLEREVDKRTSDVVAIQDVTTIALASLAETRDSDTGNHIRRTQFYVKVLAENLRSTPGLTAWLVDSYIARLYKSAPLHDIGKVGIPDRILLKPGRLEAHEFEIMKGHTTLGRNAIEHAERQLGMKVEFLTMAKEIALSHHEKWDGSGYPQGLSGDKIPISARLMAIADVYDALISRRIYKDGIPHEKAVAIIVEGSGSHFDPQMVDAFLKLQETFRAIAARYSDSDEDMAKKKEQFELFLS
jgi:putative two-component system response regulator